MFKACRLCGLEKPLAAFHQNITKADGHETQCKECRNGARRAQRAGQRIRRQIEDKPTPAPDPLSKRCTLCHAIKQHADFSGNCTKSDGLASWCKACANAKARERYVRRPDVVRSAKSAKRQRLPDPSRKAIIPRQKLEPIRPLRKRNDDDEDEAPRRRERISDPLALEPPPVVASDGVTRLDV